MALINLRNALMAGKRLPYDAELEYLESTGTQWIDTGIASKQTLKIRAIFEANSSTSYFAYGVRYGDSTITCATGTNIYGAVRWGASALVGAVPRGLADVTQDSSGVWESGMFYSYNATQTVVERSGFTITLFAGRNSATTVTANMVGKFYSCKIWDSGTLVRDYIPVRKGTVGYLYDRVTGKLFGNAGTGDFGVGQDVVPVEYIESHGTEWINTGIVPTADDSFYCRAKQSSIRDQCLWGLAGVAYCFSNWAGGSSGNGTYWGHPAIGTGGVNNVNPLGDTNWHEILCQPSGVFVDGTQINTQVTAPAQSPQNTVALFARSVNSAGGGVAKNGWGRMSAFRIERNGDLLRKYLSVRVGIEGAMMDVLTRRIYRNAGTGAFAYGNDLKYPIPA